MLALLVLHLGLALLAPWLGRRIGPRVFYVVALAPFTTAVWAATQHAAVVDGRPASSSASWVPGLGMTLDLRMDALSLLLVTLVAGVGTLIFLYCSQYFSRTSPGVGRFAAVLTGFAGAMLGLVLADDVLLLYVFWELTSVTSFLLIGYSDEKQESRRAAVQALLVTTFGGLVMLLGLIVLATEAGTYSLSGILADPPSGTPTAVALVLVLVGAFTKSAQVPFHPWLPAAMAAPTPVSAYLHAAAMVKAGVYLVARLAPAFATVGVWRPLVITVGLATMIVGGWRALRQTDLKRLLAFGTVSQLGFLFVLVGAGTRDAALAGAAVLLAHGLFKSTLFLTVGVIDHETGTRDLRVLSGLGRRMPVLAVSATLAAASMAAVPPLFGFVSKEAAYEAFLHGGPGGLATLAGLFVGSVLTGAYSARFVWGAFASKPGCAATEPRTPSPLFLAPVVLLGQLGLLLGLVPFVADPLVQAYAAEYAGEPEPYHLALWHGPSAALLLSSITLGGAAFLFLGRERLRVLQRQAHRVLGVVDADRSYDTTVRGVDRLALRSTAVVQTGSLPVYLGMVLLTLVALPGAALLTSTSVTTNLRAYDTPLQLVVGAVIAVAAVATARAHRRFTAVLYLGAVGYGIAVLFVLQGGPDLALTQFLVETLTLVVFVFVLRRLPAQFSRRRLRLSQGVRVGMALAVGAFVTVSVLVSTQARTQPAASQAYLDQAYPEGHGRNVVNVVLVDFRGLDTLGEITVLAVAAMGITSLVLAARRRGTPMPADQAAFSADGPPPDAEPRPAPAGDRR
ncbi:MAG TPA: Na+/H+ antiporter subunit A [Mycobacteriales bacterium]|nr:Na+/H+ antiporter subunit A [Mycobacteriales bacterium]